MRVGRLRFPHVNALMSRKCSRSQKGVNHEKLSHEPRFKIFAHRCRFAGRSRGPDLRAAVRQCAADCGASVHPRRHAAVPTICPRPCPHRRLPRAEQEAAQSGMPFGDIEREEFEEAATRVSLTLSHTTSVWIGKRWRLTTAPRKRSLVIGTISRRHPTSMQSSGASSRLV
jgi:hypothetical protein